MRTIVIVCLLFFFAACKKDKLENGYENIVGTWQFIDHDCFNCVNVSVNYTDHELEFQETGNYIYTASGKSKKGRLLLYCDYNETTREFCIEQKGNRVRFNTRAWKGHLTTGLDTMYLVDDYIGGAVITKRYKRIQ